ncbi:MAG: PspC domain-containing protein [Acidimicrobiales bacterium]
MVAPRQRRDHRGIAEPAESTVPAPPSTGREHPTDRPVAPHPPAPWLEWGHRDGRPWHPGRGPRHRGRGIRLLRGCRRSRDARLFGGVANGIGQCLDVDPTFFRIGFVLLALLGGFGVAAYLGLWLIIPLEGADRSIASRAVSDRRGLLLTLTFLPALVVTAVVGSALKVGYIGSLGWPLFVSAAGLVLIWRNCDEEERAWLRQAAEPVVRLGTRSDHRWRQIVLRFGVGVLLLTGGIVLLVDGHSRAVALRPIGGAALVIAACVVLFGPWWLRLGRDLVAERQARVRAEDRADMAARVHDSVLQSLAMIRRSADQPQKVVQLARAQERELRAWLFEGSVPGSAADGAASLAAGIDLIAREVEADHGVSVDVVAVGDSPLDDALRALLGAAREATVNAAKWAGVPTVSLYAEVEPTRVSVFVRDRGAGFDPDAVAEDRRGIAQSIQARMLRNGGRAVLRSRPGEGTEVELTMPRVRPR